MSTGEPGTADATTTVEGKENTSLDTTNVTPSVSTNSDAPTTSDPSVLASESSATTGAVSPPTLTTDHSASETEKHISTTTSSPTDNHITPVPDTTEAPLTAKTNEDGGTEAGSAPPTTAVPDKEVSTTTTEVTAPTNDSIVATNANEPQPPIPAEISAPTPPEPQPETVPAHNERALSATTDTISAGVVDTNVGGLSSTSGAVEHSTSTTKQVGAATISSFDYENAPVNSRRPRPSSAMSAKKQSSKKTIGNRTARFALIRSSMEGEYDVVFSDGDDGHVDGVTYQASRLDWLQRQTQRRQEKGRPIAVGKRFFDTEGLLLEARALRHELAKVRADNEKWKCRVKDAKAAAVAKSCAVVEVLRGKNLMPNRIRQIEASLEANLASQIAELKRDIATGESQLQSLRQTVGSLSLQLPVSTTAVAPPPQPPQPPPPMPTKTERKKKKKKVMTLAEAKQEKERLIQLVQSLDDGNAVLARQLDLKREDLEYEKQRTERLRLELEDKLVVSNTVDPFSVDLLDVHDDEPICQPRSHTPSLAGSPVPAVPEPSLSPSPPKKREVVKRKKFQYTGYVKKPEPPDLEKHIRDWRVEEVLEWFQQKGHPECCPFVLSGAINGKKLIELTDASLKNELGVASLGHRHALLTSIKKLVKKGNAVKCWI